MYTQHPYLHSLMSSIGSALHGWHETERHVVKAADWTSKPGVEHTQGEKGGEWLQLVHRDQVLCSGESCTPVVGSSGGWHVGAAQEMWSRYRTGSGPVGRMLINESKLNCQIRVTMLRAHGMIKQTVLAYTYTSIGYAKTDWISSILPLFSESYSIECKGNWVEWTRLSQTWTSCFHLPNTSRQADAT